MSSGRYNSVTSVMSKASNRPSEQTRFSNPASPGSGIGGLRGKLEGECAAAHSNPRPSTAVRSFFPPGSAGVVPCAAGSGVGPDVELGSYMNEKKIEPPRPWDAQLARRLIMPLVHTRVTPNHLTTVRLLVGVAGIVFFMPGTYLWSNVGALLFVLSNFLDHTDGELARVSGKTSRAGHIYDLVSDALIHVLLFAAIGVGVGGNVGMVL